MKGTLEFYEKKANFADENINFFLKVSLDILVKKTNKKSPIILDLCCGTGQCCRYLEEKGAIVYGIDFCKVSIDIAKKNYKGINFYVDNILNDYSYVGIVDAITIIAGLVHIENNDLKTVFFQMSKHLKKGGLVFVSIYIGKGKNRSNSYCIIEQELYDRKFWNHTLEELIFYSKEYFAFKQETADFCEKKWGHYIFERI